MITLANLYPIKYTEPKKGKGRRNGKIIVCYEMDGTFKKEFPSIKAAGAELEIGLSNISRCCNNEGVYTAGNYRFAFKGKQLRELPRKVILRLEKSKQ